MTNFEKFNINIANYAQQTAIVDQNGQREISYARLNELSGRVATKLKARGCQPGDAVMVCMERSMEYVLAYIGVLKAGCVVVPVVLDYPKERIDCILQDSQAKYTIEKAFFSDIESYKPGKTVILKDSAPALLIYTSGSTGKPKGILHSLRSLGDAIRRNSLMLEGVSPIRFGATGSMSFVVFILEYLATLNLGGCVHILGESTRRDILHLEKYFEQYEITISFISPQMLSLYKGSRGIKRILTGSDVLRNVYSTQYELYNLYGMSETLVTALFFIVDKAYDNTPIGKPVEGVQVFLLNEKGEEVPENTEGEICLKGFFADGYLHISGKTITAQRDGTVLVRTGDIGFRNESGNIVYLCRKDWMVKINGQRVEVGEIEKCLRACEAVKDAVVKSFQNSMGQTYLVAYYTGEREISSSSFCTTLKLTLPEYMLPQYYKRLESMPVNSNGKLDRLALTPPDVCEYKGIYAPPENDRQALLCQSMEKLLQCGTVGIDDDFFSLGGNSIKVLALIADTGINELTPDIILRGKTVRYISDLLEKTDGVKPIIHQSMIANYYSLTEAQLGVYLQCNEDPQSMMYNIPICCTLPTNIDLPRFAKAVKCAMEHHRVLGVRIGKYLDGTPCMKPGDYSVEVERKSVACLEEEITLFIRPFHLENELLYRTEIVSCGDDNYFLLDIHHLIFDGSSLKVLMNDIARAYDGEQLAEETLTLFDISVYEHTLKESEEYKEAQLYFENLLKGIDVDSLPISDITDPSPVNGTGRVVLSLGDNLSLDQGENFVRSRSISEASLFLGAFAYALAKFNGGDEALFCTVNNGRHDYRLENSVGMFVKTLPVYLKMNPEERVSVYLKRVQDLLYEEIRHDCISFAELANHYGISANLCFVYQSELFSDTNTLDGRLEVRSLSTESIQFDVIAMVHKREKGYELSVDFRTGLYSSELMNSFADMVRQVISEMISVEKLADISLVSSSALSTLDAFNCTDKVYEEDVTVVDLFHRQVKRSPSSLALVFQDKSYSYKELNRLSDIFAKNLRAHGVGQEKVVAVLIPRCEYIAIASLAVLKAGGAYLPMDPSYPPERLNLMIRDSGAMLLISTPELSDIITGDFRGKRIMTEEIPKMQDNGEILLSPKPADLFIILYTSGSTGTPKGVMLTHHNLNSFCAWHRRVCELDDNARIAAYASYGFDANMQDLYPAFTAGSTVYIIPDEMRLDLAAVHRYFTDHKITYALMTTQIGRQFALMGNPGNLRLLAMGGEKLTPFFTKEIRIANVYGPTECTIISTYYEMHHLERDVPIGKPLDNMKLYVVDVAGKRLPLGAVGELWISGPQVARGYLNRPEQNAVAFSSNPFSCASKYASVYHTGDIVRLMPDGNIQFIGRKDAQIKIRGFRIELTEVEEIICRYPGIRDATIVAYDDAIGGKYIAAYVVSDSPVDMDSLKNFILVEKPSYMVPAVIMQLDAIPYNQNQKVNRRALPVPEWKAEDAVPPNNDMQKRIFACIADVLGHESFGINTDIYSAGMTSIATVKLIILLSEAFKVPVKTQELKENCTVEKLEQLFREAKSVESFEILKDYPLTKTQEGIFVESIAKAESTIYNIPLLFEIGDSIDFEKLKHAIVVAVNAHPFLKMRLFMNEEGDVRQRRMDADFSFHEAEIGITRTECLESIKKELVKPFHLLGGRLFRIRLIEAAHKYILIDMHHIISDGTSMNIFLRDIGRAYRGEKLEIEKFTGYEVVLNEQKLRQGECYEKAKAYYADLLEDIDTDSLPIGDIRDFRPEGIGRSSLWSHISVEDIKCFCNAKNCGLNAFFTSVFGLVLSRFNSTQKSAFACIYNGRSDSRLSDTVGMLVKTLPVVTDISDHKTVGEYTFAMNRQLLDSMANDIYSFSEISREYGFKADVMFIYQGSEMEADKFCDEPACLVPLLLDTLKSPWNIFVYLKDNRIRWAAEYNAGLYSEEFINGFLEALDKAVSEFLIQEQLNDVSILTDAARCKLENFNATDYSYDETQTVVEQFVSQAKRIPKRIAVVYQDRSLTYGQLDRLTYLLAQHLSKAGIGPNTVVAILIPRCEDMVICSMGVLRAGGAYLPLDLTYPTERLNLMIRDSGARVLITTPELSNRISESFTGYRIMTKEIEKMEDLGIKTVHPKPEDLFIMLYTSGSTGLPKGVMLEHRNVLAFFSWYIRSTGVDEKTHASSYASYGFDACMQDIYPALMCGGCVYIIPDAMRLDLLRLREYFCENEMTHAFMTTQIGRQFALMEKVPSMKLLIMGGEKLVPFTPPDYMVFNGYGPSECAMGSSMYRISGLEKDVPIGKPLTNLKMYVVDTIGHMLPPGASGELWISGPQVSRGYLNRPELTAAVYTKNPFSHDEKHSRVYHTGDIVRWLPDGNLQFIGRRDCMVKIRGFRIELTEVEEVIRRFPSIKDATVAAFDDHFGGKYLAAYLVSDDNVDIDALKQFILREKPSYMLPSAIMQLDAIPYTQNQKVNRRALPEPERRVGGQEAANEMEMRFCKWFAEALGLEKVYADDDFFALGGSSISVAKIAMKCATKQIPIVYQDIFDYTTPRRLSEFILSQTNQKQTEEDRTQTESTSACQEEHWEVLKHNIPADVDNIRYSDLGNVLVVGATGFLGIHVLKQLIDMGKEKIFCLIRKGQNLSAEQRLKTMLAYYFNDPYDELFEKHIIVLEGDILDKGLYEILKSLSFDTVINCAANVKHFTHTDISDQINFHGVENLIDICLRLHKKLIQTSTISVSGTSELDLPSMTESMLSFGQRLENKYVYSKWMAEKAVLTAIQNKGLRGKIIRLGNLMGREKDAEFQVNFRTNGFMNQLRAFAAVGYFPISRLDSVLDFSAIDCTAKAVVLLSGTPDEFTVFHANNCHRVHMANVIQAMIKEGIQLDLVDDKTFRSVLDHAMQDEKSNMAVSTLIFYNTHENGQKQIEADNSFTVKALYRLGFFWPIVSEEYIRLFIRSMLQLGFFA